MNGNLRDAFGKHRRKKVKKTLGILRKNTGICEFMTRFREFMNEA